MVKAAVSQPSNLLWQVSRSQISFLRKTRHKTGLFSRNKRNLKNRHSYKFSGIANQDNISVSMKGESYKNGKDIGIVSVNT